MKIGRDNKGLNLRIGDICKFKMKNLSYEGMIGYSEDGFAFTFEMLDDKFPCVYMSKADLFSIERVISVYSTDVNDKTYGGYRKLINMEEI